MGLKVKLKANCMLTKEASAFSCAAYSVSISNCNGTLTSQHDISILARLKSFIVSGTLQVEEEKHPMSACLSVSFYAWPFPVPLS